MVKYQKCGISVSVVLIMFLITACGGVVPADEAGDTAQETDNVQTQDEDSATPTDEEEESSPTEEDEDEKPSPTEEDEDEKPSPTEEDEDEQTENEVSSPSSASSQSSDTSDMQVERAVPPGIAAQLSYLPPQAGGGEMIEECRLRADDYESMEGPKPDPYIELFGQPLRIGQCLTTCYIGFTDQTIVETILGPNGETMRSVTFTAEFFLPTIGITELDGDVTDYMVLPGDPAGTYTVRAETPQGTLTQEFEVIDQIAMPRDGAPFVTVLSRGTSQRSPSALQDGLVFLSGFFPNEELTLTFWQACKAQQPHLFSFGTSAAEFVIGAQVQVNDEGRAFLPVPDEISAAMQDALQYELLVIGSKTPNDVGTTDISVSFSSIDGIRFSTSHGNAFGLGQPQDTPLCSQSAQSEADASESGERQQYQVIQTQDGFVTVRAEPTTSSTSQARLDPGTIVDCTDIVMGVTIAGSSSEWAYCPEAGGYIFLDLLTPYSGEGQQYQVIQTQDGFVTVRAEPTTSSASQARLDPGTIVDCTDIIMGETIAGSSEWTYCPEAGGYIFLDLLIPYTPDESSTSDTCGTATVIEVAALSIQDNPSVNADSLGAVEQGESVDVLCVDSVEAEGRIWVRVRYGLIEGWMSTRYLQQ